MEKKHKFKNKGILYLLQLFNKDVTKMIQFHYSEQSKIRAEKIRQKKVLREQDLALRGDTRATLDNTYGEFDDPPLQRSIVDYGGEFYGDKSLDRDESSLFDVVPNGGVSLTIKKGHNPK